MTKRPRKAAPRMAFADEVLRFAIIATVSVTLAVGSAGAANAGFLDWLGDFFAPSPRSHECSSGSCPWANYDPNPNKKYRARAIVGSGAAAKQSDGAEYQSCPC